VTNALPVEYFGLDEDIYNFERLLTNPLRIEGGAIMLGSSPGIGVEFDPDALAEFTVG
jgi:L-alanine-DL-glutamate epimerase-like enolase superfamily enzyme